MTFDTRQIQISRNRDSRERWSEYFKHRERITQFLTQSAVSGGKLLVAGAGNCNDIDLGELRGRFQEIHLLDLDSEALAGGVNRQGLHSDPHVALHGGFDVTGIAAICSQWDKTDPPNLAEISHAEGLAQAHTWANMNQQFDTAASIGLLSQLAEMIIQSLGEGHSRVMELLTVMRLRHMQLLIESVRPGGRVLLVTEIVSSDTCPELAQTAEDELGELVRELINSRNFFTGLNPVILEHLWRHSPDLAPRIEQVQLSRPWLWDFGRRVYACYALTGIRRHPTA